nr:MMPL family transporter [Litorivivens lipolytica]
MLFRLNHLFERLPGALLPYRWLSLILFVAIATLMMTGLVRHFAVNMSPEVWFEDEAGPLEIRNAFRRQFGSDESVFIVYRPQSGDVFSEEALRTLEKLHTTLTQLSEGADAGELGRIVDIDSLYNARYQIAQGDTLISKKLIGADFPETESERERRRAIAESQDSFERMFYSDDFQYGGIRIKTDFGVVPVESELSESATQTDNLLADDGFGFGLETSLEVDASAEVAEVEFASVQLDEYARFMNAVREITQDPAFSDFEFHYVGNPATMDFVMNAVIEAGGLLTAMVALVVILLWVLFRSLSAVIWPLLIVYTSAIWAIGTGAWLGMTYTTMLALTFMLVLAVGIASCIHVLSAYTLFTREGKDHHRALALAYRKTGIPILLTSVTTMIGMLALTLTDMPIITTFGITSALAVGFSFLLIFLFLPILLDIWHPKIQTEGKSESDGKKPLIDLQPMLAWIADFTERRAKAIVVSYVAVFALLIYGAFGLSIDTNFSKLAREGTPLQSALELVDKDMMGGMDLEVFLDFNQADALQDPAVLKAINELQNLISEKHQGKVIKTFSLADIVEDTNQVMNGDDPAYHRLPDDPRMTAQLLYLFNNANPDDRRDMVSDDYSKSHISFMLKNGGTNEYTPFFNQLDRDIEQIFAPLRSTYPDMSLEVTGTFHMMMNLMDHVAWTQVKSFSFALFIITLLMMVTLGSYQAGLISMIPNLLPAVFTFGVMGALGIPLDTDTLIVAPIIIGIAVDDTIHFLTHYRYTWIEHGDVGIAVRKTLREVGQAVAFTSLILGLGFGVLGFAGYLGLAKPGIFGGLAILVALLSDLLFLPALMHWLKPDMGRRKVLENNAPAPSKLT